MDELKEKIKQHFTVAEFVEFLDLDFDDIFDYCDSNRIIEMNYGAIASEVCFEFEEEEV